MLGDGQQVRGLVVAERDASSGTAPCGRQETPAARPWPSRRRPLAAIGDAAGSVPQGAGDRQIVGRLGRGEHFVPAAEADQHLQRHRREAVGQAAFSLSHSAGIPRTMSLIASIASLLWPRIMAA